MPGLPEPAELAEQVELSVHLVAHSPVTAVSVEMLVSPEMVEMPLLEEEVETVEQVKMAVLEVAVARPTVLELLAAAVVAAETLATVVAAETATRPATVVQADCKD
jgi:hypothetical protein